MKTKITQSKLAEWCGISSSFLSEVVREKNYLSAKMANRLCSLMGGRKSDLRILRSGTGAQIHSALQRAYLRRGK
jgi:plasmid maintenance system antidote protein VapI